MATIKDVADLAQVSIKTVSRVLNSEPHVRPELAERVRSAVETLSYLPNQSARRLAGGRSFLIAFVYNNPTPSYIAAIQRGAALRCRELGYHLVVEPVELEASQRFNALKRLVATLRPDGAFLIPPLSDDIDLLEELEKLNVRTIRIAGTIASHGTSLATAERDGGVLVTEHLLALGHRKIAMIGPPLVGHVAAMDRLEGFKDAMKRAGIPVRKDWVCNGEFDFESGMAITLKLLGGAERPTAIFAANDEMALGAMMAARTLGLRIPEDLSVAGFDDTPASASSWPPLTTVRQPLELMGSAVIDKLTKSAVDTPDGFKFSLVIRASTTAPQTG